MLLEICPYPILGSNAKYFFTARYIPGYSRMCKRFLLQTQSPRDQTQSLQKEKKKIERSSFKDSKRTNFMRKKSQYSCLYSLWANENQIRGDKIKLNFITSDRDYFIILL